MADTTVESSVISSLNARSLGLQGPYWINKDTAIIIFLNLTGGLAFARTTNGGANWSTTEIDGAVVTNFACWFDQETPGDTGTLIHIGWLNDTNNDASYVDMDISDGSQGTIRTIDAGLTVEANPVNNRIAITKTVSGNLICAFSTQTEIECYKSDDNFATAGTAIADPFETATEEDWLLLYPANTGDDNDACGIFWDRSANLISIKMYDDSENDWTESIFANATDSSTYINMDAAVRHSDNHILVAFHTNGDSSTDDLQTWDLTVDSIDSPTETFKSFIFTDQAESAQVAVLINQQNDDVYVSYLKGGTWLSETDVVFHKSDDGMSTWGSEQAYNETTDDNRLVHGGRTIGDSGGRIQWSWFNDDLTDIFVNLVNDIEISAIGDNIINETDTTILSDSLSILEIRQPRLIDESDTTTLSESLTINSIRASRIFDVQDTTTLSDSLNIIKIGERVINELDTTTLSDSLIIISDHDDVLEIDLDDTTNLSDSLIIERIIDRRISELDTTTLSDSLAISRSKKIFTKSFDDTTNLSDSLTILRTKKVFNKSFSDTLTTSDNLIILSKIPADVISKVFKIGLTSFNGTLVLNDEVIKLKKGGNIILK
jgi:hypothetical protein